MTFSITTISYWYVGQVNWCLFSHKNEASILGLCLKNSEHEFFFILIGFLQLYVHTTRNVYNTKRWMSGIKQIKIYYHAVRLYIINIFIRKITVLWDLFSLVHWYVRIIIINLQPKLTPIVHVHIASLLGKPQFLFSRNDLKSSRDNSTF